MFKKSLVLIVACVILTGCSFHSKLKAGDRVIFFGDSITYFGDQKGGYVSLVRDAVAKARPGDNIQIVGAGIPGNKVPDLLARVDSDVIAKKPSLVVIYIGINDVWHWRRYQGTPQDVFEDGLNTLIDKIQAAGAKVILCTPTVIGEKVGGGNQWDNLLDEYADIARKVAKDRNLSCIDLRALFKNYINSHNPQNLDQDILTKDKVHLNPAGDKLVAKQMLKALGE